MDNEHSASPPVGDIPIRGVDALVIAELEGEFDRLCRERSAMGDRTYGAYNYLDPDVDILRMLLEEVIDIANYARMIFVRIRVLEMMGGIHEMDLDRSEQSVGFDPRQSASHDPT